MDTMENTWDKFQKQLQTEEESFDYEGTISFTTNKRLTPEQLDQIVFALQVQMEEPADEEGNDVEISHKIVDTFIKLIDKSDKIKSFSEVVEALRSLDEVKEEGSVGESIFEKTERRIKSKLNGKAN
jgi:hypothetical protein